MADDEAGHINQTIDPILDFLSLKHLNINYSYYYVGKYNKKDKIDDDSMEALKEIYKGENKKLFDLIGREIKSWA